jgi:magnesium-transporting ATPase (P-type)
MDDARLDELRQEYEHLSRDGFRVLAIGSKDVEPSGAPPSYGRDDEKDVILNGYTRIPLPAEGHRSDRHPGAGAARCIREDRYRR